MEASKEKYTVTDGRTRVTVNSRGAEIVSVLKDGTEYMWDARPEYWGRTSPVLFPLVGSLKGKQYRHNGTVYPMGQHGFARDMEFEPVRRSENQLTMALTDNEDTLRIYPFHFRLEISYALEGGRFNVGWRVVNTGKERMYFSIGGHPAFMCPLGGGEMPKDHTLRLYKEGRPLEGFVCTPLTSEGTAAAHKDRYDSPGGAVGISRELFLGDALILEDGQADRVALAGPDGREYVAVEFDAPLVGLWSPAGKDAPFVCIEPWYGRCDGENFDGELKDREWGNRLEPGEEFLGGYRVFFGE